MNNNLQTLKPLKQPEFQIGRKAYNIVSSEKLSDPGFCRMDIGVEKLEYTADFRLCWYFDTCIDGVRRSFSCDARKLLAAFDKENVPINFHGTPRFSFFLNISKKSLHKSVGGDVIVRLDDETDRSFAITKIL